MQINTAQFGKAWLNLLSVLEQSTVVSPRGMACREHIGVTIRVSDGRFNIFSHPDRGLNYRFMVAEWLWIWYGHEDVATISQYNKEIARFSDNGETFDGAYGPRVAKQWPYIVGSLKRDLDTRQAVINIFESRRPEQQSRDVPCTLSIQFLARYDQLHTIVCMRSSDIWLGLPYDFFNFSMLGNILAGQLGLEVGSVTMHLGSSHLYERNLEAAQAVLASSDMLGLLKSPYLGGEPPVNLHAHLIKPTAVIYGEEPWLRYFEVLAAPTKAAALIELVR